MEIFKDILAKYTNRGSFIFRQTDTLRKVCNVPENICGVYFYTICREGREEVLYIGCSGHMEDGKPQSRKNGGLKRRIYGKQENVSRNTFYKNVMVELKVPEVKVYWFDTGNDDPQEVEYQAILKYILTYRDFPRYNYKLEKKQGVLLQDSSHS